VHIPKFAYTTDNAAMIAMAGFYKFQAGLFAGLEMTPYSKVFI
jgi:N6-L-threonylcarbamoyladenine synthase